MFDEHTKHIVDGVAIATGTGGTLAQWSDFAGELTPILSMIFVGLSLAWLAWRMVDRIRFGPRKGD